MLISVIRRGRVSASVYMHLREGTGLTYICRWQRVPPHCRRELESSWFPQALSSTEPELEHSVRWPGCSSLTMAGCVHSEGMPSKGGSFALHELHGIFTEISQKWIGRLVKLTLFCWNKSLLLSLDSSGRFTVQSTGFYSDI